MAPMRQMVGSPAQQEPEQLRGAVAAGLSGQGADVPQEGGTGQFALVEV
jgi:hypothetical protein